VGLSENLRDCWEVISFSVWFGVMFIVAMVAVAVESVGIRRMNKKEEKIVVECIKCETIMEKVIHPTDVYTKDYHKILYCPKCGYECRECGQK